GGDGGSNIGVQLFAFKVGGTDQFFTSSHVIDAIVEASVWTPSFGYGVHVLNYSGGGDDYNEALRDAVRVAAENDVVFVASKGNDDHGELHYPSDYDSPWVLSVGASTASELKQKDSNFGNGIDVVARGFCVAGTDVDDIVYTTARNNQYRCFPGTSAAAPHVAGLAALMKSEDSSLQPEEIEGIIRLTADNVAAMGGADYTDEFGDGRINAGRALERLQAPYEIERRTAFGGTVTSSTGNYRTVFFNPGGGLASAAYIVRRHEVRKTVTIDDFEDFEVFCRGPGDTVGWSDATPNHQVGHCDVLSTTATSATLRTWVYQVYSIFGSYIGYRPSTASGVRFAYTISGIRKPPGPEPPRACFTVTPVFGDPPLRVTVNASCSSDPDSSNLSYSWDMGDGSTRTGVSFSHWYVDGGNYSIRLRVTDDTGLSDFDWDYVFVNCDPDQPPGFFCEAILQ
ncbi:MAG: S8 family serine peptidase, partial [Acidobacteriota bacterium]